MDESDISWTIIENIVQDCFPVVPFNYLAEISVSILKVYQNSENFYDFRRYLKRSQDQ